MTLPTLMPHFDPSVHRTLDVVRVAIIPACADEQNAYAKTMMNHKRTWAKTMVTHSWQNLFRDLVASVLANALGWPCYEEVAVLLDRSMDGIETLLSPEMLSRTYWECAFSVNQHQAICGQNRRNTTDPATGLVHPICACGAPKYFNNDPPLRADGKSTQCELNKFDDMMAYMSAKDKGFTQLIAVDRKYVIFSRCWCVAEIVQAAKFGMRQSLIICSFESLKRTTTSGMLNDLRIENMEAARKEDIDEILSKILDVALYNAHLQTMFFDEDCGLLVLGADPQASAVYSKIATTAFVGHKLAAAATESPNAPRASLRPIFSAQSNPVGPTPERTSAASNVAAPRNKADMKFCFPVSL